MNLVKLKDLDYNNEPICNVTHIGSLFYFTKRYELYLLTKAAGVMICAIYIVQVAYNLPMQEELNKMPFRVGRVAACIAPERAAKEQGYQVLQSLYAMGSGGFFRKVLDNSVQNIDRGRDCISCCTNLKERKRRFMFML